MSENLTHYKTNAWQDTETVDWYSARMLADDGTFQLKNAVEVETIKRFIAGRDVIDIGIGTGRASMPLLESGHRITGIDSSQAMLDETRRLANGAPIELKIGDITHLPCADQSFDCAISLNVLVHFPTWKEALQEWRRVLRPGGRIIFDVHAQDHVEEAFGKRPELWPQALRRTADEADPHYYMQRIGVDELVSFANEAGFSIAAIVPYGAFLGGGNINWFLFNSLEQNWRWKRLLSWFSRDKDLFELGLFLEQTVVAHLSPKATGRMFVVLDNKEGVQQNLRFAHDLKQGEAAVRGGDSTALFESLSVPQARFFQELESRCGTLRCRHFLYFLVSGLKSRFPGFDFSRLLPPSLSEEWAAWQVQEQLDRQGMNIVRDWAKGADFRFMDGVDLTLGCEYELIRDLFVQYFGIFGADKK